MLKKITTLALALTMVLAMAACSNAPGGEAQAGPTLKEGVTLQSIVDDVTAQYPVAMAAPLDDQLMTDMLEINLDDVEEYAGSMGMSITTADNFFAIRAKPGKTEAVQTALEARLDYVRKSFEQYLPLPREKANAGKVLTIGDYVFLIILGKDDVEDLDTYDFSADVSAVETQINTYFNQ